MSKKGCIIPLPLIPYGTIPWPGLPLKAYMTAIEHCSSTRVSARGGLRLGSRPTQHLETAQTMQEPFTDTNSRQQGHDQQSHHRSSPRLFGHEYSAAQTSSSAQSDQFTQSCGGTNIISPTIQSSHRKLHYVNETGWRFKSQLGHRSRRAFAVQEHYTLRRRLIPTHVA